MFGGSCHHSWDAVQRYFVRRRGNTDCDSRDSVDACQRARSSLSLSASLRDESSRRLDRIALDGRLQGFEMPVVFSLGRPHLVPC